MWAGSDGDVGGRTLPAEGEFVRSRGGGQRFWNLDPPPARSFVRRRRKHPPGLIGMPEGRREEALGVGLKKWRQGARRGWATSPPAQPLPWRAFPSQVLILSSLILIAPLMLVGCFGGLSFLQIQLCVAAIELGVLMTLLTCSLLATVAIAKGTGHRMPFAFCCSLICLDLVVLCAFLQCLKGSGFQKGIFAGSHL